MQGKNRSQGGPLLQRISSSDLKATATNQIHSNDLEAFGMKCCYFFSIPKVKFLVILPYFNAIFIDFYAVKCLIYIYFV